MPELDLKLRVWVIPKLCLITLWLYLSQIKPLEMGIHPQATTIQFLGKTLLIISFVLFLGN